MIIKHFRNSNKYINLRLSAENEFFADDSIISDGFYINGIDNKKLFFFYNERIPFVLINELRYELLDSNVTFKVLKKNEKESVFICSNESEINEFTYEPFFLCELEDEEEYDVDFGLWLLKLKNDPDFYSRVEFGFTHFFDRNQGIWVKRY